MRELPVEKDLGFMASRESYREAAAVLLGVPMDCTASFRPGSRLAPRRVREVSRVLEEYSLFLQADLRDCPFHDWGDLVLPCGNTPRCLEIIRRAGEKLAGDGKLALAIGGEHLITLPLVEALAGRHNGLAVLHLDAHADLREEYLGERYSHSTVMRRVAEVVGGENLFQCGIRSADREELLFAREHTRFRPGNLLQGLREVVPLLRGRPVYVSLDIDVADPAYAPGTGTPEPGGCTSEELLEALYLMRGLAVVGFDLVEVSPVHDASDRTAILAAKVIREALLLFVAEQGGTAPAEG